MHRGSFLRQLEVLNESLAAQLTDGELLERFAWRRDETAFAVVVHRHGGLVLGVCRRILPIAQDAEDAYQATFLVLARKAHAFRSQKSIANWLYGVARRTAMKSRERAARRRRVEKVAPMLPEPAARPQSSLQEICALLDDELSRLPARYRQPLLLCYMESHTRDQAAAQLGWSRRTLYRRLERGLEVLRR